MAPKRLAQVGGHCVACGSCVHVCPRAAISIWKGVTAQIHKERCVGCGKCQNACPAGTISLVERGDTV